MTSRVYCSAQALCVAFAVSLAACGGGGGGSGPDLFSAPGLTLTPTSVSFTAIHNGATPPTQNVQVTVSRPDAQSIVVGFPVGVTPPTWLDQAPSRFFCTSGISNCTLVLAITDTTLAAGTYTTTIRFGIRDTGQNLLALRDVQLSYTVTTVPISASPSSLNFSSAMGGPAPAAQTVTLGGDPVPWTASANQSWIGINPSSGFGGGASVSVNPAGLGANTYNGTVTFTAPGHTATVNVSLSVAAPAMQASTDSLSFSGINGATLASQSLNIAMNNGAALSWTATTPPADTWLVLNRTNGTASDPLGVSVNPANGTLASGIYNSSISLQASSGGSTFNKTVNVTMALTRARLIVNPASVTLGGSNGRDFSGVPVQVSVNTDVNSFAWTSTPSAPFIQRSPISGSFSATPQTVTLTPNASGLTGGTRNGFLNLSVQVNGDTVPADLPVTFNLESHKLLVDGNGVAFAKTPTLSKLTQTLKVRDNLGLATSWTAAKTQLWLTVTGSGTAGDSLVLIADPTGLATDTLYLDTVTITSPDTSVENTEKVRVGLWVGAADPTATSISVATATANIAADPIRPYAYATIGGNIGVYNTYTGSLVTTITNVSSGAVGFMTVSHDGSTLYAFDIPNSKIVPVNLDTQAAGTPFSITSVNPLEVIDYTRTNGVELILSGSAGQIFNAQTGAPFPSTFAANTIVAASRGGTRMCTVNAGSSPYSISCPTLDFTSLNGGHLLVGNTFQVSGGAGSFGNDLVLRADGAILYVASGAVTELSAYSTAGQNPAYAGAANSPHPTGLHPNNAEIAADGRLFASAANPVFNPADVWVFDANGTPLTTLKIAAGGINQILDRQLRISGDGIRLITITGDQAFNTNFKLNFTTIP